MPANKDLKRRIRARMVKTGESYTAARSRVVQRQVGPAQDYAAIADVSDAAVEAKTDGDWKHWIGVLDRAGAVGLAHRDIARLLHEQHGVPGWWAQTITVTYERARGLRDKGQRRGGGYDVNKSKTLPVPIGTLYGAFAARRRRRWLGDVPLRVRKATPDKSMRITWGDGLPVDVSFWAKGPGKSQVQIQHRGHATRAAADAARAAWGEHLAALARFLTPR